jgi:hypothetical protein
MAEEMLWVMKSGITVEDESSLRKTCGDGGCSARPAPENWVELVRQRAMMQGVDFGWKDGDERD